MVRMKCTAYIAVVGVAVALVALTPKTILVKKIHEFVTGFFNEQQLAKAVDIAAIGIHLNKPTDQIMNDLYDYMRTALNADQTKILQDSYTAMSTDLGDEGAADVSKRIKKIIAYAITPAVDMVRVQADTPEHAYAAMSRQLNPDFVSGVLSLVRDMLTTSEWSSVKRHYGPLLRIVDYWENVCEVMQKKPSLNSTTAQLIDGI